MAKIRCERLTRDQLDEAAWDAFISGSPQGTLYQLSGYLDAIHPNWEALIAQNDQGWLGLWPLPVGQKNRFRTLLHPPFSQACGPCLTPINKRYTHQQLATEQRILRSLIEAVPPTHLTQLALPASLAAPFPFAWAGYQLTVRYTYQLSLSDSLPQLHQQLYGDLRRRIRKAEEAGLQVKKASDQGQLKQLIQTNLTEGHAILGPNPAWGSLDHLCDYLLTTDRGEILHVIDPSTEEVLAAGLFGWFHGISYYLVGAQHPQATGREMAVPWLLWQAIQHAQERGLTTFDFEGSMLRGVGEFFRQFNASPISYVVISQNRLPLLLRWIQELRSLVRARQS